jgi:protein TonB
MASIYSHVAVAAAKARVDGWGKRRLPESFQNLKHEQWAGLLFVLALHAGALAALWRLHIIGAPAVPDTLMVEFINPPPAQSKPPVPEPPKLSKSQPVEPPEPQQLVADAPVVKPDEPVAYAPPVPPEPVVVAPPAPPAPPMPQQPVVLSGELSVSCPERTPPDYPRLSMRMNEQGKVVLHVELEEDGGIVNAQVKTSSGFARLDAAALAAVKTWRCKPVIRNGVAVHAVALQPFNFMLEGG